jgi:preprotein translocase subunit SecB
MTDNTPAATNGATAPAGAQLSLQKVYIKDASFEVPGAPHIFQDQGQPQVQLNLAQQVGTLANDVYEVVLTVTVTCKIAEKTAYLAEVQQAGVFGMQVSTIRTAKRFSRRIARMCCSRTRVRSFPI